MKRTTDVLHFVNTAERTYKERQQEGYQFEVPTQDGAMIQLFVYNSDGFWYVNDVEVKCQIVSSPQRTRNKAVFEAKYYFNKITLEDYVRKAQALSNLKAKYSKVEGVGAS